MMIGSEPAQGRQAQAVARRNRQEPREVARREQERSDRNTNCRALDSLDNQLEQEKQQQQAGADQGHADEADLAVRELEQVAEDLTPTLRKRKRHEAFEDEHQRQRQPQDGPIHLAGRSSTGWRRRPHIAEELRRRVHYQEVRATAEAGSISLEAAVEREELLVLAEGCGIDR